MEKNNIRKLTIGDHIAGLSYQVGQVFNRGTDHEIEVFSIVLDKVFLTEIKVQKYDIYVVGKDKRVKPWKSFSNQKTMVEFEC